MGQYKDECNAKVLPFIRERHEYAKIFSRLTGETWTFSGDEFNDEGYANSQFALHNETTDLTLSVYFDHHSKRVSCSPCSFKVPNGSDHGRMVRYRDMISYAQRNTDKPLDAGVSLERFITKHDQVATRFLRDVYQPLLAYLPQIKKYISDAVSLYDKRDVVVRELCERYNGAAHTNGSGYIHVHFSHSKLSGLRVSEGGYISFDYNPTFSLVDIEALFNSRLTEK